MRCPVCKAENTQGPQCRRCKTDLTLLFRLEELRQQEVAKVKELLVCGQSREAVERAERADWLRSDADSLRLLALAHLLNRDFSQAWRYHQAVRRAAASVQ
jgi:hypothetical protein